MRATVISRLGGPEVMEWLDVAEPEPGPGQILVAVEAAGVNFMDTYQRTGLYQVELPFTPGSEGAGQIIALGADVHDLQVGDRVAWCDQRGTYADRVLLKAARAVVIPAGLSSRMAAASLLQGVTAHYLTRDTFPLRLGHRCLVHAAAGGVGHLLVQLAKQSGAEVIATVGGPEKVELAKSAGADHVIDYRAVDFGDEVERLVGEKSIDVVYDGVGRATFERGLTLLRPRGLMATYGNASGPVDPIAPLRLSQLGSLFLTRPGLAHHIATTEELRRRGSEVFDLVGRGDLEVRIGLRLPMTDAAEAHRRLESRSTTGKVLLEP